MSIENYRKYIIKHAPNLTEIGFSYIGEDDYSIKFTDGIVFVTFIVEPGSDFLEGWVEFLSDELPDDTKYRLDLIMEVFYKRDISDLFKAATETEKDKLVNTYIEFIVQNKEELFGEYFPLSREYTEYNQRMGKEFLENLDNFSENS